MKKEQFFKHSTGFTLLELVTVLGIIAILTAIAVPRMGDASKKRSVESHQRSIFSALNYARGMAVSQTVDVAMCPSPDDQVCGDSDDWNSGWLVFVDNGANGTCLLYTSDAADE